MMNLEPHFNQFRQQIVGIDKTFVSPFGIKKIIYADWIASGRLYRPIEEKLLEEIGPFIGNTHTEDNITGGTMTQYYMNAKQNIKKHVNASKEDILIATGSGMTAALAKLQRILGLKIPYKSFQYLVANPTAKKPKVFITHMEHHSNQTSWLECYCDVTIIPSHPETIVDLDFLRDSLKKIDNDVLKIASITACSNVTGIETPYYKIADIMHEYDGYCFVDFACSAPYVKIDMHPTEKTYLDSITFSPHKFLGGVGTPGILVFNKRLYDTHQTPDHPGGGTVKWTNPWNEYAYIDDIEEREDGGTPAFLQTIKASLAADLKDKMDVHLIHQRENELLNYFFDRFEKVPSIHILDGSIKKRLGVLSFYIDQLHYNLGVKLLNDIYGIQVRGGCSCAGTYGHYLLNVSYDYSHSITHEIDNGNLSLKPGWIRLSVHPTMTNEEAQYIADAIEEVALNFTSYKDRYHYDVHSNHFAFVQ
jgi:selenocysteine lyase/cysteine desulfurase